MRATGGGGAGLTCVAGTTGLAPVPARSYVRGILANLFGVTNLHRPGSGDSSGAVSPECVPTLLTGSNLPKCPRPVPRPPVQLPRKRRLGKFEGGWEVAWPSGQLVAQSRKDGRWRSPLQILSALNTVEGSSSSLSLEAQHRYTNELGKPLEIKRFHIRKGLFSFS